MAYKVIILYRLYMPSYFLGTFTEYPFLLQEQVIFAILLWIDMIYIKIRFDIYHIYFSYDDKILSM